jgi:predicted Holliday junction resolvase-like endonuclease
MDLNRSSQHRDREMPNALWAGVVMGLAIGLLLATVYVLWWKLRYTRAVRADAVQRSLAVTTGKVYEQLVPYLPGFGFNPKDVRFLGTPVDLVVFDGLSEGTVRRIVFVEVKTAAADLSTRERRVRDAVRAHQVEWSELRVAPGTP